MKRAFVCGASGFIGGHLAKKLKAVTGRAAPVQRRWMAPAVQELGDTLIG